MTVTATARQAVAGSQKLEARRIAFVTTDETALPSIDEHLVPVFHTTLLQEAAAAQPLPSSVGLDAIILDLESGGNPTSAGLQALRQLRTTNPDVVLVALSRSQSHTVRAKAENYGADDFFVAPLDFHELQVVLLRAIRVRALEIESRQFADKVSEKTQFCEIIGGSEPMRIVYEAIT